MSILDGQPHVATKEHCNAPWSGDKRNFRCAFCGHRFKEGDVWRFVFTNDMPDAPGNPLICAECDGPNENVRDKWRQMHKDAKEKYWWFIRWVTP